MKLLTPVSAQSSSRNGSLRDRPRLVYLPGMDCTGKLLHRQVKGLAEFFDIRCLSILPNDLSSWQILTQQAISVIQEELEDETTLYLCGESFGGCLALKIALMAPWLLEKLILVNPASSLQQRPWLGWGGSLTQWMPEFLQRGSALGLLPFLANLGRIEYDDRRALLRAMQSLPQATVSWRLSLLINFDIDLKRLAQFTQPTLIIASASDRLLPSVDEAKRLVKSLPNAKQIILPISGHACLLETDIQLVKILEKQGFLPNYSNLQPTAVNQQ